MDHNLRQPAAPASIRDVRDLRTPKASRAAWPPTRLPPHRPLPLDPMRIRRIPETLEQNVLGFKHLWQMGTNKYLKMYHKSGVLRAQDL